MANLKAFALNIAKQIKPDDSIECIAEIIEQQIESVWLARARQVMEPNAKFTRAEILEARLDNLAERAKDISNELKQIIADARAALAAHEEGGGGGMRGVTGDEIRKLFVFNDPCRNDCNIGSTITAIVKWLNGRLAQPTLASQEPSAASGVPSESQVIEMLNACGSTMRANDLRGVADKMLKLFAWHRG